MSNKVYSPSAAPASQRLVKGDQGISKDEVKFLLLVPSAFVIRYSIFCGLPALGGFALETFLDLAGEYRSGFHRCMIDPYAKTIG